MKHLPVLLLISLSICTFGQDVKLTLASDVWPPFTNTPDKKAVAVDLVTEALRRTGIGVKNEIADFAVALDGIKQGVYQGSAAVWKTAERENYLHFSNPYLQNNLVLVGLKGANVSARKLSELIDKRVAVVGSYAYGPELEEAKRVTFVKGENDQENLEKLFAGQVDYILVDDLLIQYVVNYQQKEAARFLAIGNTPLFTRSLHFGIRKDVANADQIIQQFNMEITKMIADGTYNRILELNWIQADVDGDGQLELVLAGDQAGLQAPTNSYHVYFENQPTASTPSDRYYINGQIYKDWESIPTEYKVANLRNENLDKVTFLKFSLN